MYSSDQSKDSKRTTYRNKGWFEYPINKGVIKIGRSNDNDLCLDNLKVSRHHASVVSRGNIFMLYDNDSYNGIFVNGQRVKEAELHDDDVIYISTVKIIFSEGSLFYKKEAAGTRLVMKNVSKVVKMGSSLKHILSNVNLTIEANEFVAIIGGSGAGKTTIMNAMSGFEQATDGEVYVNSINLYENYDSVKNIIGYVPQQDIIYENLTLYKMLKYSAKMRISKDISEEEIEKRICDVLDMIELSEHKDKLIKSMSGGQKKRASIAVELLSDPGVFFLDEPTSGLDPGTEESLMKNLSVLSKQKNKTIIMVTHTVANIHLCDKVLFMGRGGKVCFYGSVPECLNFFSVESMTEIYNMLSEQKDTDKWSNKFYAMYGTRSSKPIRGQKNNFKKKKESFIKQFILLASRYAELIISDKQRLFMLFFQPILIAMLINIVAKDGVFDSYNETKSILFALSCAGIWLGLFNSIQEICKERIILKREYMANLRLDSYILSKFFVQFIISILQANITVGIFTLFVGLPEEKLIFDGSFISFMITMLLTMYSSAGIGLMVSAISKNSDKAMTVAPFLLIIQLLFSGILFVLDGITELLSYLTISRWSVSAFGIVSNLNSLPTVGNIPRSIEDIFSFSTDKLFEAWGTMIFFSVICIVLSVYLLRNVSKDSR